MDQTCIRAVLLLLTVVVLPNSGGTTLLSLEGGSITSITRLNSGDTFQAEGIGCDSDTCVGLSSGTAALPSREYQQQTNRNVGVDNCLCRCHSHLPAFREDLQICVDDIRECILAPFVSGSTTQHIPFVFLPLRGQIIHPSKEIRFADVSTPICGVSGAKFLTEGGWVDLRNPVETDVPFRLYRDEGRTFLQWEGEPVLRNRMSGRLVLVHLKCRDLDANNNPEQVVPAVEFSPCVAFRVVGTAAKYSNNVSEVIFSADAQSSAPSDTNGLSISEIIAIGICSVLLGLIYVASVFLYLHIRRKRRYGDSKMEIREKQNVSSVEEGIIKNNPLLVLGRHFPNPDPGFSDTTESDTDVTPDILQHPDERKKNMQLTAALVHPYRQHELYSSLNSLESFHHQDSNAIERLPEENVSIVETLEGREDRPENVKAIGTTRKKLYFNPAYFEPHLLQTPPPAAIEFLTKIREVITMAKQKMATKRFSPNLLGIPEEESPYSLESANDHSQSLNSRRGSVISLKRGNSRRRTCQGCPDCDPREFNSLCGRLPEFPSIAACENCSTTVESKQHSIRKWLEDIPVVKALAEDNGQNRVNYLDVPKISPARSLPPNQISSPVGAMSPKASSDKVQRRKSLDSPSDSDKKVRRSVVKPNCPPPPLPKIHGEHYMNVQKSLPPPDMIHEAMAVEEVTRIPTITKKKMNAVIDEFSRNVSETSKSRQLDYETDSLERSSRDNKGFSTPTEYADASSSQPSPSLSTALPMAEELTMQNAIINAETGNMTISKLNMGILQADDHDYELIVLKKGENFLPELLHRGNLVSEVYVNNGYNYSSAPSSTSSNTSTLESRPPKVRYDEEKPGHLLIEVEDCPDNYIKVEDSDEYEPDTLDRKQKLTNNNYNSVESDDYTDSLERPTQILLRTTGSFKCQSSTPPLVLNNNFNRNFGSLREIYEAKTRRGLGVDVMTWRDGISEDCDEGRLLTLEERHSRRQRKSTTPSIPPDVIPPSTQKDSLPIYEQPKPPRKVVDAGKPPLPPKNSIGKTSKDSNCSVSSSNSSDYEPIHDSDHIEGKCDASILRSLIHTDDIFFKHGINNQFILQARTITSVPDLSQQGLLKGRSSKVTSILGKYLQRPEDSGYLSTDSDESKRKRCKCMSGAVGSETDESLCDGHSESGAESIETHSVFFDSFRKPCFVGSLDSGVDSDLKGNSFTNVYLDDAASTDSENVSFKTVIPTRRY